MEGSELTQRRERGRMAQRAFRQRQITTIRELKDKNQTLVDAIDNMTQTAALFSRLDAPSSRDKTMLEIGIQRARRLAGLGPLGESNSDIQGQDSDEHFLQTDGHFWPDSSSILESIKPRIRPGTLGSSNTRSLPTRPLRSSESPSIPSSTISQLFAKDSDASSRGSSPSMTVSVEGMFPADSSSMINNIINDMDNPALVVSEQYNNTSTGDYFTSQEITPTSTTGPISGSISASGRVSPNLTYGVWFEPDRFIRIINPPRDILPYLGNSMNTLAGAIFWAGMGYGYSILKKVLRMRANASSSSSDWQHYQLLSHPNTITYPSTTINNNPKSSQPPPSPPPDPKTISTRIFGHAIHAASLDGDAEQILHDVIHARFTWREQGYITGDHPGADPDIPTRLFAEVVKEMMTAVPFPAPTSRITTTNTPTTPNIPQPTTTPPSTNPPTWPAGLQFWMSPLEIEAYVRARLSTTATATSQFDAENYKEWMSWEEAFRKRNRGGVNTHSHAPSSETRSHLLKKLVRALSDKGVCFGNSPRWRVDVVSACVDEWMGDVEGIDGGLGMGAGGYGFEGMSSGGGFDYNGLMGGYGGGGDVSMGSSSSSMYGSDFLVSEGVMEGLVF